jgi:hypothetical protein
MKFNGIEELTAQIVKDADKARDILARPENAQTRYADKKVPN